MATTDGISALSIKIRASIAIADRVRECDFVLLRLQRKANPAQNLGGAIESHDRSSGGVLPRKSAITYPAARCLKTHGTDTKTCRYWRLPKAAKESIKVNG